MQTRNHLAKEVHSAGTLQGFPGSSPSMIFSLSEEHIKSLLIKFVDDIKVRKKKKNKDSLVLQAEQNWPFLIKASFDAARFMVIHPEEENLGHT